MNQWNHFRKKWGQTANPEITQFQRHNMIFAEFWEIALQSWILNSLHGVVLLLVTGVPTESLVFHPKHYFQFSEKNLHVSSCISKSCEPFFKKFGPTWSYDTPLQNATSPVAVFFTWKTYSRPGPYPEPSAVFLIRNCCSDQKLLRKYKENQGIRDPYIPVSMWVVYYLYNSLLTDFGALIRLSEKHLSDPPPEPVLKMLTAALWSH